MDLLDDTLSTLGDTLLDVAPIVAILFVFQTFVLRRRPPNLRRVVIGFVYVVVGLGLFLIGLEEALFPIGKTMATQLTAPQFIDAGSHGGREWNDYLWIYAFAFAIGFATTIAEPALIAVSLKAKEVSGGAINVLGLRLAVAIGVAVGVALGTFRIVTGTSLPYYIIAGYVVVLLQTWRASKSIIPLAYDSGGVTTSTVTVPVITALGLGLASTLPERSPLIDGFGLIAFASVFPIMSVLAYASLTAWIQRPKEQAEREKKQ
jgi:hypothetical protein